MALPPLACRSAISAVAASLLIACLLTLAAGSAQAANAVALEGGTVVDGYVRLDALKIKSTAVKILINGGDSVAFVRSNGYFSINLSPGTHTLQVTAPGAFFLPVMLQISAKHAGNFRAVVIREQGPASLSIDPLIISPFAAEEYFEKREPFTIWTLLKNPMGIMICLMLVVMVILPRLADSIDPEEMKQMQEQMQQQQVPSLSGLLSGNR
ncbi:hypothetical protein CLOM_g22193 [Closterium sp. NIES-68]|nr:hypothetical protein CLOM_g22193 [Closterium sp. NIES-68]GJP86238.1 hypothetical protein CLOP_g16284 [Closterium sp. NIES-67]